MEDRSGDTLRGAGRTFALVISRFNEFVTRKLRDGALDCLEKHGTAAEDVHELWVPGAFEIPLVAKTAAESGRFDAVICLGAVIRGETPHFDFVAGEASSGLGAVAREIDIPLLFGVLTTDTADQARARASLDEGDKGRELALSALHMIALYESLEGS